MAVPKKKTSSSKRNMRRSHHALKTDTSVVEDKHTGEMVRSHHVCDKTGMYKGEQIIDQEEA